MFNLLLWLVWILLLLVFYHCYWKCRKLPPGPIAWPIVGNMLEIMWHKPGYHLFERWTKQFGPVYTYWLGPDPIVAVTDFELIKETFLKDGDAYSGRYFMDQIMEMLKAHPGINGVIRTEGEEWYKLRKASLKILKDLGMGSSHMEQMVQQEVDYLIQSICKDIEEEEQKPDNNEPNHKLTVKHDLIPRINLMAGSTINQVVFGFPFHGGKEAEFHQLKNLIIANGKAIMSPIITLVANFPFLLIFPFFSTAFDMLDDSLTAIYAFFDKHIQVKIVEMNETGNVDNKDKNTNCFVGQFLAVMETAKGRPDEQYYGLHSLRTISFDLFVAGQETTSSTISFLVLYLLLDQRVQNKLHKELDERVGACRTITYSKRSNLPFLNAVINETMRLCNLLPQNLIHKTTRDVQIQGYSIAKGTKIVPQISCVLFDEKIFPDPQKFLPERFLNSQGQLKKCEELIPFSIGKRQCLGESLARMQLFLFAANFFNTFRVYPSDSMSSPTVAKITGFGVNPTPYTCLIERRYIDKI